MKNIINIFLLLIPLCQMYAQSIVKDIEGNTYKTVEIGNQEWMAENLKTTKYNDGSDISSFSYEKTAPTGQGVLGIGQFCWYLHDISYKDSLGALYNYFAIKDNGGKNICPTNWHVSNSDDWLELLKFINNDNQLNLENIPLKYSKSLSIKTFYFHNTAPFLKKDKIWGNYNINKYGFSVLPAPYLSLISDEENPFRRDDMVHTCFWSLDKSFKYDTLKEITQYGTVIIIGESDFVCFHRHFLDNMHSVRCVKD